LESFTWLNFLDFEVHSIVMNVRPLMQRARSVFHRMKVDQDEAASSSVEVDRNTVEPEKSEGPDRHADEALPNNGAELPGVSFDELQHGVQEVEAVAQTWSKPALIFTFIK
jgi:hypothetical protein